MTRGGAILATVKPLAVHHVSVNVADAAEGIAFYTDVLGGTLRTDRPDLGIAGAWIDLGATQVHLIETRVPPNLGQHFAILVDDLDGAVAELRDRGFEIGEPMGIAGNRQTFILDPSGNAIELHEVATA